MGISIEGETSWLNNLIRSMPKAELHLHLDGSLQVDTALELARAQNIDAPRTYQEMYSELVANAKLASQTELLRKFNLPVSLMQDEQSLIRVTRQLIKTKSADNVKYFEIRWAPKLHTQKNLSIENVIDIVTAIANQAAQDYDVTVRLIVVAVRSDEPKLNQRIARIAGKYREKGVVGFDLAGLEKEYPDPLDHQRAFEIARNNGLHITAHSGEIMGNSEWVWRLLRIKPERIAHGINIIEDNDLVSEIKELGITLDQCPTSNVQSNSVDIFQHHPIMALYKQSVSVTISTDDPTISNVTLSDEYVRAIHNIGFNLSELWKININALHKAFAEPEVKNTLIHSFEYWAQFIPELNEIIDCAAY